jgi:hypothetical protein
VVRTRRLERQTFAAMTAVNFVVRGSCRECLLVWARRPEQPQHTRPPSPMQSWLAMRVYPQCPENITSVLSVDLSIKCPTSIRSSWIVAEVDSKCQSAIFVWSGVTVLIPIVPAPDDFDLR